MKQRFLTLLLLICLPPTAVRASGINFNITTAKPASSASPTFTGNVTLPSGIWASDGDVGIGTASPSAYLDIEKEGTIKDNTDFIEILNSATDADNDGTESSLHFRHTADGGGITTAGRITMGNEADWGVTFTNRNSYMAFYTTSVGTDSERVRIDSGGNMGIGTTSPNEKLHVDGRIYLEDSSTPGTTTNRMYALSGGLFWNGSQIDIPVTSSALLVPQAIHNASVVALKQSVGIDSTGVTEGVSETTFNTGSTIEYPSATSLHTGDLFIADGGGKFIIYSSSGSTVKSSTTFDSGTVDYVTTTTLRNGNAVIAYRDVTDSNKGKFIIYDPTGEVVVSETEFNEDSATYIDVVALTNGNFMLVYNDTGSPDRGAASVYSSSGVLISEDSSLTGSAISKITATTLPDGNVFMNYIYIGGGRYSILDPAANTVTHLQLHESSERTDDGSAVTLANGYVLLAYKDTNLSDDRGKFIMLDQIGNRVKSATIFESGTTNSISATPLPNGDVLIAYQDEDDTNKGKYVIYDNEGSQVVGPTLFHDADTQDISTATSADGTVFIAYEDGDDSGKGKYVTLKGSGATFSENVTVSQNIGVGTTSFGASSVGVISMVNGTAPTGSVTDGVILYAEDVGGSSELKVRDEAGNVVVLSDLSSGGITGIGDSVGSGTANSVLFIDSAGNLGEDNANFYWDDGNARLGIGNSAPTFPLEVTGLIASSIGFDGVGAVDLDYGSADITDHTFVTDGTGTAEIVLPAGSIDSTEILDSTIVNADIDAAAAIDVGKTALVAGTNISLATNTLNVDDAFILNTGDVATGTYDFGGATFEIPNSTTLPATCTVGDIYMDTDATSGQRVYACESTNTWALQGDGGGAGGVTGPGSATDEAIVRFDGTSGTLIQDSSVLINDSGFLGLGSTPAGAFEINIGSVSGSPSTASGLILAANTTSVTDSGTLQDQTNVAAVMSSYAAPTLDASSTGVTTTDAANVYIAGPPTAGTNMTITNPYALWIDTGNTRLDGELRLFNSGGAYMGLQAPTAITTETIWSLPDDDGTSGQLLSTDGVGALGWADDGATVGGAIASGTANSVLFIDSAGNLGEDNANFYWDGTNAYLGVGTNAPGARIHGNTTLSAATGNEIAYELDYTTNKATSGNDTGLLISMTDTASPGTSLPLDVQVGGSSVLNVDETGILSLANSSALDTVTGGTSVWIGTTEAASGSDSSVVIGEGAGDPSATGDENVFIGRSAGEAISSGGRNVFVGRSAGSSNSTGFSNIFIGYSAGSDANDSDNVFIGDESGQASTSATRNVFLGSNSGYSNTTADDNVFIGETAGYSNQEGARNTFVGQSAGYATTSSNNTFVGNIAGFSNTTGISNVALGKDAFVQSETGSRNVVIGEGAGYGDSGDSYSDNTLIGHDAGNSISTGGTNVLIGSKTGDAITTGAGNIVIGYNQDTTAVGATNELNIGGTLYGDLGNQNIGVGTTSFGASSAGVLSMVNGTAPTGSVTDGIILYAEDVGGSSELKVRDEAGNVVVLSDLSASSLSIGDSVGSGTANSVLFIDSAGNLGEDNTNFYWDGTNVYLGIGTTPTMTLEVSGGVGYTPSSTTSVVAGTGLSSITNTIMRVDGSGGAVTVSATPSIVAGQDGQILIIQGDHDTNTVTFQDESNLTDSDLQLSGGLDFTLGKGDTLQLTYDAGDGKWYELYRSDN